MGIPLTYTGNTVIVSPSNANGIFDSTMVECVADRSSSDVVSVGVYDGGTAIMNITVSDGRRCIIEKGQSCYLVSNAEISVTPCEIDEETPPE